MPGEPRPLKAIFFDVDDTLYSTTAFAEEAQRRAVEAMQAAGLDLPFDPIWSELCEVISEFSSNDSHHYEKLLQRLPARACDGVNPALVVAAGVVAYHETKVSRLEPFPEVLGVFERLTATALTLGVITSGLTVKQAEKLVRLGVLPFLDRRAIFITEQVGMAKSNPRLFQRACAEVGVEPAQALYVGDKPVDDVAGPKQAGMVAVLRTGTGKHAGQASAVEPDYRIAGLDELEAILARDFVVPAATA